MIKLKGDELLNRTEYVREPVDCMCKKIVNESSNKIIINSGSGSGKSTVLYNLENRGIGQDRQFLYARFDSVVIFHDMPNQYFDERFINHYYELVFSSKIMNYIDKYYSLTYESKFKDLQLLVKEVGEDTDCYIKNVYWENGAKLIRILEPMQLSSVIIDRLKNCLNISSLGVLIDRFDSVHGSSELAQHIISKYFSMFDRTIIVVDDEQLQENNHKKTLLDQGYTFIDVDYGSNQEVLKEIIRKRIKLYAKKNGIDFNFFSQVLCLEDICQLLINKTNGNISLMLDIVWELIMNWQWTNGNRFNLKGELQMVSQAQLNNEKQLKKMYKTPKLYL